MIYYDKIEEVLSQFEGKRVCKGYIPCNLRSGGTANYYGANNVDNYIPMGVSGVTIATGVDLGQTDIPTLRKTGVSENTINILKPYIGKTKRNAVLALNAKPLLITAEQALELDRCMHAHHIEIIARRYDKDAGVGKFETIPWQAQAVIVSILYQRGTGSPKHFPNTWRALVNGMWREAAEKLMNKNLWTGYHSRRCGEGKILATIFNKQVASFSLFLIT